MIIFLFLTIIAHAQGCLDPLEVQQILDSTVEKLAPFLQTLKPKVQVVYEPTHKPIMAYTHVDEKKGAQIRLTGTKCNSQFLRDEIQLLVCHEIGHLAGGEPYMNFQGTSAKLSSEGQADFYAVTTCLPFLWKKDSPQSNPRPEAVKYCAENENPLCARIASASLNFQEYHHELARSEGSIRIPPLDPGPKPKLHSFDSTKVKKTLLREYPSAQCRLDIMKAGIQCESILLPYNFHQDSNNALSCSPSMETAPLPACYRAP